MKKKIKFFITVGSYVPEKKYAWQLVMPVGGESTWIEIEFETDKPENAMDDAFEALAIEMDSNIPYHIWYWSWIE